MLEKNKFNDLLKEKEFLIIGHRGFWAGNIIQNTRHSVALSKRVGADIAEIDICKTLDGKYYLFHNNYEEQLLRKPQDFQKYTSEEIDSFPTYNTVGGISGYSIEKFDDFLEWLPEKFLINIDRAWKYFGDDDFFEIISKSRKENQLFLKARLREFENIKKLNDKDVNIGFVPIIESREEYNKIIENCPNLNIIGIELVIKNSDNNILKDDWLKEFTDASMLVIANAEHLGIDNPLHYGLTDDTSLFEGEDEGWGQMLRDGANAIITHWPNFLDEYRNEVETSAEVKK